MKTRQVAHTVAWVCIRNCCGPHSESLKGSTQGFPWVLVIPKGTLGEMYYISDLNYIKLVVYKQERLHGHFVASDSNFGQSGLTTICYAALEATFNVNR